MLHFITFHITTSQHKMSTFYQLFYSNFHRFSMHAKYNLSPSFLQSRCGECSVIKVITLEQTPPSETGSQTTSRIISITIHLEKGRTNTGTVAEEKASDREAYVYNDIKCERNNRIIYCLFYLAYIHIYCHMVCATLFPTIRVVCIHACGICLFLAVCVPSILCASSFT